MFDYSHYDSMGSVGSPNVARPVASPVQTHATQMHATQTHLVSAESTELQTLPYRVQQMTFLAQLASDPIRMIPGGIANQSEA